MKSLSIPACFVSKWIFPISQVLFEDSVSLNVALEMYDLKWNLSTAILSNLFAFIGIQAIIVISLTQGIEIMIR